MLKRFNREWDPRAHWILLVMLVLICASCAVVALIWLIDSLFGAPGVITIIVAMLLVMAFEIMTVPKDQRR